VLYIETYIVTPYHLFVSQFHDEPQVVGDIRVATELLCPDRGETQEFAEDKWGHPS
jgi:hypothetical protein